MLPVTAVQSTDTLRTDSPKPEPGAPAAGGSARERDDWGHYLPRSEAPQAPGSGSGAPSLLPAGPRPAHKASVRIGVKAGKTAKNLERASQNRARAEIHRQALETARAITQMMISAVKLSIGEECDPSPALRQRMEEPGSRMLERMNPDALAAFQKWSDPMQLGTALAEWGAQILRVVQEKQALQREAEEPTNHVRGQPHPPETPPAKDLPGEARPVLQEEPAPEFAPEPFVDPDAEPGTRVDRIVSPAEIASQMMGAQ